MVGKRGTVGRDRFAAFQVSKQSGSRGGLCGVPHSVDQALLRAPKAIELRPFLRTGTLYTLRTSNQTKE